MIKIVAFGFLALAAGATAQPANPPKEVRELLQDCSAHRFETVVSAVVDGQLKRSRMKLCGTPGQSDADWVNTLRDSAAKIAANPGVPPAMRTEMVKALNAEIASLSSGAKPAAPPVAGGGAFTLKPRATPPAGTRDSKSTYTSLPPLPPPVVVVAKPGVYVPPPSIEHPDLAFECFSTGTGAGEGPCMDFDRYTVVVVQAKAPVSPGASLRFIRDGEDKGEIALAALKKGQRQRIALPSEVCKGINGGRLKIETMVVPRGNKAPAQVADTQGPFDLRC